MQIEELKLALGKKKVLAVKLILEAYVYSFYKHILAKYEAKNIDDCDLTNLELTLTGLDFIYISGEISPLRDEEYDTLHNIYNELTGRYISNKYENNESSKVTHIYPDLKGTLDKVHYVAESDKTEKSIKTHKSLEKFLRDALDKLPSGKSYSIGFYFKFDGISVIFAIKDGKVLYAITRGDMDAGEGSDITSKFNSLVFDYQNDDINEYGMKTEVVMDKKSFAKFISKYRDDNRKMNDARSVVSGILNSDNVLPEWLSYLTLVPLMYEINNKFSVPETYLGKKQCMKINIDKDFNIQEIRLIIDVMKTKIDEYDIECDGVVVRFLDEEAIEILGRNYDRSVNRFEVAFKFPAEEKETILTDVVFSVGKMGKISAVAKVEPVKIKNRTIKSISLGSIDRFKTLNLRKGDIVKIKYDIIPYLDKEKEIKNENSIYEVIDECPFCQNILEYNPELMCVNNKCSSRIIGKITNYCDKMGIEQLGESTVEEFFNQNILNSIDDLYRLKEKKDIIIELHGFGEKKFNNIIKAIEKQNKVEAYIILGSLGIPSIGRKIFKNILNIYYIDVLMGFTIKDIDKLIMIPGVKETTAKKIIDGIIENKETIEFILKNIELIKNKSSDNNLVFTNIRNHKFENYLEELGYEISDSVNKKTLYVITDSIETNTGKIEKAKKLGVPVLTIDQAYKAFNF